MATKYPDIFAALAADFPGVKWKPGPAGGKKQPYVTARQVMNRLDDVLGPENWSDDYEGHENSVLCKLTVTLPDGSTLTKQDAGGYPGMADNGDDEKAGYSDAFKRAAVKFGVGRLFYGDGAPEYRPDPATARTDGDVVLELVEWCGKKKVLDSAEKLAADWYGKGLTLCTGPECDAIHAELNRPTATEVAQAGVDSLMDKAKAMLDAKREAPRHPAPDGAMIDPPQIPDEPKSLLPPPEGQTKGQKLAGWCARQKHTQRASALAWSNHKCKVEDLTDAQADALYALLEAAKPVADFKPREAAGAVTENGNPKNFGWPHSGSALFAWSKQLEQAFGVSIIKPIDAAFAHGGDGSYPRSYKEWTPEQVRNGAVFAAQIVKPLPGYDGQFDRHVPDLDQIREELVGRVMTLSRHLGTPDPTYNAINLILQRHSAQVAGAAGETIDDVYQCENENLLKLVLDHINRDIADAEQFAP